MGWILILFAHVGPLGDGNSNALSTAEFTTQQACVHAGKAAETLAAGTTKQIKFVCASQR